MQVLMVTVGLSLFATLPRTNERNSAIKCCERCSFTLKETTTSNALPGSSEGILVCYRQPSEVQLTHGGGVAEPDVLKI